MPRIFSLAAALVLAVVKSARRAPRVLSRRGPVRCPLRRPGGHGPGDPELARPMRGSAALTALGDELPEAARLNGLAPAELEDL